LLLLLEVQEAAEHGLLLEVQEAAERGLLLLLLLLCLLLLLLLLLLLRLLLHAPSAERQRSLLAKNAGIKVFSRPIVPKNVNVKIG